MDHNQCVICMEQLAPDQKLSLPCGHDLWHADCLVAAMRTNPACPLCRDAPAGSSQGSSDSATAASSLMVEFSDGGLEGISERQFEDMISRIAIGVTNEMAGEVVRSESRRSRDRRNRRARRDPDVRRARDEFWSLRQEVKDHERRFQQAQAPLKAEMREMTKKHTQQLRSEREALADVIRRRDEAEQRFIDIADAS